MTVEAKPDCAKQDCDESMSWSELRDWLRELVWQAMASRDMSRLLKLGFTDKEVKMLCCENPKLLNHFLKKCQSLVEVKLSVKVNHREMQSELRGHFARVDIEHKQRQLVQYGAPFQLLKDAYRITNANYRYMKTLYDVEDSTGRIPSLSITESKTVWRLWNKYLHIPLVDRYIQIHEETAIPIKALWMESRSWVKDESKRGVLEHDYLASDFIASQTKSNNEFESAET